jgi:hypothetical protein
MITSCYNTKECQIVVTAAIVNKKIMSHTLGHSQCCLGPAYAPHVVVVRFTVKKREKIVAIEKRAYARIETRQYF